MFTKSVLSSVFALFIMLFSFIVWANNNESNTHAPIAIALHGGAGTLSPQQFTPELKAQYYAKLSEALEAGYRILQTGADGQDAGCRHYDFGEFPYSMPALARCIHLIPSTN